MIDLGRAVDDVLDRRFRLAIALLCAFYLAVQIVYVLRLPLVMDEFQTASMFHQLRDHVPYRDFPPYKTTLGYYLILPGYLIAPGAWSGIMSAKLYLAVFNTAAIAASCLLLSRWFRRSAVAIACALLVSMTTFLEQSTSLRVDMMTAWFGVFSLLALLGRRPFVAGALAGASFLVSQKGIYFPIAGGLTLTAQWALLDRSRARFEAVVRFGFGAALPVSLYLGGWSLVAGREAVIGASIVSRAHIALAQVQDLHQFWFQSLFRNPAFYGLAVLGLGSLWVRRDASGRPDRDWIAGAWCGLVLLACLWHKQPWPYFLVFAGPPCFVLTAALLDGEAARRRGYSRALLAAIAALGIAHPLWRIPSVLARSSEPQRFSVEIAEKLLAPGESYLAGMHMVHTRPHAGGGRLNWLDTRRLAAIDRAEAEALVETLRGNPPKLVIWNYRIAALPPPLSTYLQENYGHFTGNVFLYSPMGRAGALPIAFAGEYLVVGADGQTLAIDGRALRPGESIHLEAGSHQATSEGAFRLALRPAFEAPPRKPDPLFTQVYNF